MKENENGYLEDGQKVYVSKILDNGFLVQDIYQSDGEPWESDHTYFVEKVFNEAPIKKYHDQIEGLNKQIDEREEKLRVLNQELYTAEKNKKEKLDKFKKYGQLQRLEDFLEGRLTHYAVLGYSPEILIVAEAFCPASDKYERIRDTKLLSLFGRSNGDLEWRLNYYSDGSGGSTKIVMPCCSYEEALALVQADIVARWKSNPQYYVIEEAKKFGVTLDPEGMKRVKQDKIKNLNNQLEDYAKKSEEIYKEVMKIADGEKI